MTFTDFRAPSDSKSSTWKRLFGLLLSVTFVLAGPPQAARAFSTAREVTQARSTDREIVTEQGVVQNPLLNAWVDRIAASDWHFAGRKDVPYSIKILDESDVNAFTTGGGFIYINEGALDFVGSDDELAGVIGHETGHNERRHPITQRQRGELLSILFGLAAIFAPVTVGLGSFAEEGMMAHASRTDEYQADQYGIMVMNAAGYDPDAMVSFMRRLGAVGEGEEVDKYLADHPGVPERIKRLASYPELSSVHRSTAKLLRDALHDVQTSRFSIAAAQLQRVLLKEPQSATAWLALGRMQVALGFPSRARQSFEKAALYGDHLVQAAAGSELRALPYTSSITMLPTGAEIAAWRASIVARRAALQHDSESFSAEVTMDRLRLASIEARLNELTNDTEELAGLHDDEKSDTSLPHQLEKFGRSVNATMERASTVLGGVGTLSRGRESGTLNDASEIMQEIAALVADDAPSPATVPRLRAIPAMLSAVAQTQDELHTSVAQTTFALARLNRAVDQFDAFLHAVKAARGEEGDDLDLKSNARLRSVAGLTKTMLDEALETGNAAADAYNRARALGLENRITLLGVDATPAAGEYFRRAVARRCGIAPPSQALIAADHLTPGEVAAATILAAEKQRRADEVVSEATERREPIVTPQNTTHSDALALEIFLGLIYLDYTDELPKAS